MSKYNCAKLLMTALILEMSCMMRAAVALYFIYLAFLLNKRKPKIKLETLPLPIDSR